MYRPPTPQRWTSATADDPGGRRDRPWRGPPLSDPVARSVQGRRWEVAHRRSVRRPPGRPGCGPADRNGIHAAALSPIRLVIATPLWPTLPSEGLNGGRDT